MLVFHLAFFVLATISQSFYLPISYFSLTLHKNTHNTLYMFFLCPETPIRDTYIYITISDRHIRTHRCHKMSPLEYRSAAPLDDDWIWNNPLQIHPRHPTKYLPFPTRPSLLRTPRTMTEKWQKVTEKREEVNHRDDYCHLPGGDDVHSSIGRDQSPTWRTQTIDTYRVLASFHRMCFIVDGQSTNNSHKHFHKFL